MAQVYFQPGDSTKQKTVISPFQKMVANAAGHDVVPINPELCMNEDDTTIVVSDAVDEKGEESSYVQLVDGSRPSGRQSSYADPAHHAVPSQNYLRVQKTTVSTAGGQSTNPCFAIMGLSEAEMPKIPGSPSDIVIFKVFGMTAQSHKNPAAANSPTDFGLIFFCRKAEPGTPVGESPAGKLSTLHREMVLDPFIENLRVLLGHVPGTPIDVAHTVVITKDGCGPPLLEDIREEHLDQMKKMRVIQVKGNAGRTGVEQPCDVAPQYKEEKRDVKLMKPEGAYETRLEQRIYARMLSEPALNLSASKMKIISKFGAIQARLESSSNTSKKIIDTFVRIGWIDKDTHTTPDPLAILGTCRQELLQEWVDNIDAEFESLYAETGLHGYVREEVWKDMVERGLLPPDTDPDGRVVWRDSSISQEGQRRCEILGHAFLRAERMHRVEVKVAEEMKKLKASQVEVDNVLATNTRAEQIVVSRAHARLDAAGQLAAGTPATIADATLEDFAKLVAADLKALIHARTFVGLRDRSFKWPAKGRADSTTICLVTEGHRLRNHPVITVPFIVPDAAALIPTPPVRVPPLVASVAPTGDARVRQQQSASDLLLDKPWVDAITAALYFSDAINPDIIGDRADIVVELAAVRLDVHLRLRLKDPKKRDHACWNWARDNLSRVIALLELGTCLRRNASEATTASSLLRKPMEQFIKADAHADLEGSYLHWDNELSIWIRSGKVVGPTRSILKRDAEHRNNAELRTALAQTNKFYTSYPVRSSQQPGYQGRVFDDLVCYVGIAFCRANDAIVDDLVKEIDGLFVWGPDIMRVLERVKMTAGATITLKNKKLTMLGYLFELILDLLISPSNNVSQSPGFESLFGGAI